MLDITKIPSDIIDFVLSDAIDVYYLLIEEQQRRSKPLAIRKLKALVTLIKTVGANPAIPVSRMDDRQLAEAIANLQKTIEVYGAEKRRRGLC